MTTLTEQALNILQSKMLADAASLGETQQQAQQQYTTFSDAILSSPTLVASLNANLAAGGPLSNGFDYVPNSSSGAYSPANDYMVVGSSYLTSIETNPYATAAVIAQNISAYVGHENQHATNSTISNTVAVNGAIGIDGVPVNSQQEENQIATQLQSTVLEGNDISSVCNAYTTGDLSNEASAYITGYNTALQTAEAQQGVAQLTPDNLSKFQASYGFERIVSNLPVNPDGSISLNAQNITSIAPSVGYLSPSGYVDPITGAVSGAVTYYDKDATYNLNFAEQLDTSGQPINTNFGALHVMTAATNNGSISPTLLTDEQVDENLLAGGFNCGLKGQPGSCSVVDTSNNTTNYFNIGVATSNGGTTDTIVTAQPLSSSSSSSESVSGSDIAVTADNEKINASADSSDTLNITGSTNTVISASGVLTSLQGNDNTDQLANGSSALTESGDINNTINCGNSTANINGVSADSCSITPAGNSTLTLDGSSLTGSLQGNVILTAGDTFDAESNANITMATGDTVGMGAGTSGVQLICGSEKETISNGTSGSDSAQCTIADDGLHTVKRRVAFVERPTVLPPDIFCKYIDSNFWLNEKLNTKGVLVL